MSPPRLHLMVLENTNAYLVVQAVLEKQNYTKVNSSGVFESFWICLANSTTPEIVKSSPDNIYNLCVILTTIPRVHLPQSTGSFH